MTQVQPWKGFLKILLCYNSEHSSRNRLQEHFYLSQVCRKRRCVHGQARLDLVPEHGQGLLEARPQPLQLRQHTCLLDARWQMPRPAHWQSPVPVTHSAPPTLPAQEVNHFGQRKDSRGIYAHQNPPKLPK